MAFSFCPRVARVGLTWAAPFRTGLSQRCESDRMQDEDAQVVLHVLVEDQPAAEVRERGRRRDARVDDGAFRDDLIEGAINCRTGDLRRLGHAAESRQAGEGRGTDESSHSTLLW